MSTTRRVSCESQRRDFHALTKLQKIDDGLYLAPPEVLYVPYGARGLWGGQLIGLALVAVGVAEDGDDESLRVHCMHCLFLDAGKISSNIIFEVRPLRIGKSFAQKAVFARQHGKTIFSVQISLTRKEEKSGMDYHDSMPRVPPPADCMTVDQFAQEFIADESVTPAARKRYQARYEAKRAKKGNGVITLYCPQPDDSARPQGAGIRPARRTTWVRLEPQDERPLNHTLALAMLSDNDLATVAMDAWGLEGHWRIMPAMMVTLNHTVWFHEHNFRVDEWLLFDYKCSKAAHNRGLVTCQVYTSTGRLVVTITQEVLMRHHPDAKL